jgi:hypothetical protein
MTHNILSVVDIFKDRLSVKIPSKTLVFLGQLSLYNIKGRYPNYKKQLASTLTKVKTLAIIAKCKEVTKWFLTLKP